MKLNKTIAVSCTGLLTNPASGEAFSANPIGLEIISHMKRGKSFEEICRIILDEYDVEREIFENDFRKFAGAMRRHELLEVDAE